MAYLFVALITAGTCLQIAPGNPPEDDPRTVDLLKDLHIDISREDSEGRETRNITGVTFNNEVVSSAAIWELQFLPRLRSVRIFHTTVVEDAFRFVGHIRRLEEMDIFDTKVDNSNFLSISSELFRPLQRLRLAETDIDDSIFDDLGDVVRLQSLDLSHTKVTDKLLEEKFKYLPRLKELNLEATVVTDKGAGS